MVDYEFPPEIDTENAKAWYLRQFYKLSWEEIGKVLFCSPTAVRERFKRQSMATIYQRQIEFCRECSDIHCKSCKLFQFMVKKMLRKRAG